MRIIVDCRYARTDHHDGISRYTAGVVEALSRLHPVTMLISDHRQLALLPDLPWELVPPPTSPREPLLALTVNRLRPDVVFSPMQTMGSWGRRYRLILTVHDFIYYRHRTPPRNLPVWIRGLWRLYHLAWWPQRLLLNRADAVATVSETTRQLLEDKHLTRRPITIVTNASSIPPHPARTDPPRPTLLYMGSFMPYKNVEALVRATALLPDYELHLLSRISPADRTRLQEAAPAARVVFHDGVTDAEYLTLLASATALVTASRDEGFGIPLVEAMSVGTPVVVSDIPIFREIGGDAALYVNPEDPREIAAAVDRLADLDVWRALSARAAERAHRYTWDASAAALYRVMRELCA